MSPDDLPVEISAGHRPPNAGTDRIMVGLAVVVLLGAVLIIVDKVLPKGHEVSDATASPRESASSGSTMQPSRTPEPTPIPSLRGEVILLPGAPPSPSVQPAPQFNGWIRAKVDLAIYLDPNLADPGYRTLKAGSLASAWSDPATDTVTANLGWLSISDPQPGGWIATRVNGVSLVDRIATPPSPTSGFINGLAAGSNGYLAVATQAGRSDVGTPALPLTSTDGAHWQWGSTSLIGWSFAWGPAGWLTFSVDDSASRGGPGPASPQIWIWNSLDGLVWGPLGAWIDPLDAGTYPSQLIGSPHGYLLIVQAGRSMRSRAWYSSDGVTWDETDDTELGTNGCFAVTGTAQGFYAWNQCPDAQPGQPGPVAAFSSDGTHWLPIYTGPSGNGLQIGAIDGQLLATTVDPASGSTQVWTGSLRRGGLTWRRDPGQEQVFAGAVVSAVASDGKRLAFFGWAKGSEQPLAWIRRGSGWTTSLLPSSFGTIPREVAIGPGGFVAVGYRNNLRGANPVIWHQASDGTWAPESQPALQVARDPSRSDCSSPPRNGLDFTIFDRGTIPLCLGATTLTIRAYSVSCDGCYGEPSGRRTPAWLAEPGNNQLSLSPIESSSGGGPTALAPGLTFDRAWMNHWVELTGHFDDPAALSCRWVPGPDEVTWYSGRLDVVNGCRQTFVITAVRLVDGA